MIGRRREPDAPSRGSDRRPALPPGRDAAGRAILLGAVLAARAVVRGLDGWLKMSYPFSNMLHGSRKPWSCLHSRLGAGGSQVSSFPPGWGALRPSKREKRAEEAHLVTLASNTATASFS